MQKKIQKRLSEGIEVKTAMLADPFFLKKIGAAAELLIACFQSGGKVLFCGNGGSASDAQHLAAELSGRFYFDRPPLFAEALHVNGSFLTAVSNDFGFEMAYARMVEAAGRPGDILVAMSTSGNSPNILAAVAAAKKVGMKTIAMTGAGGGKLAGLAPEILLNVPSADTPRIQEAHMAIGHILCELIENQLFMK